MTEPTTSNIGLIVPATGDLSNTWGSAAINPDMAAIDGFIGGVQTVSLSNANVVLTAPSGSITPSGGPTQSQNKTLKFTGALTGNVQITLPLPGDMIIHNLTTGNFVLSFASAASGNVIAVDQGAIQRIYNDGTNAYFVDLGQVAKMEFLAGISSIPAWVLACSIPPYLLCDGTVYNISAYPYLGNRLLGQFGGNGLTTFAVPDLRGRVPLAYDGTGARITAAVVGINGQTIGAAGGDQNSQAHDHTGTTGSENANHEHGTTTYSQLVNIIQGNSLAYTQIWQGVAAANTGAENTAHQHAFTTTTFGAGGSGNVQPTQVAGIWVVKT